MNKLKLIIFVLCSLGGFKFQKLIIENDGIKICYDAHYIIKKSKVLSFLINIIMPHTDLEITKFNIHLSPISCN